MSDNEKALDQWSYLNHKTGVARGADLGPSWIDTDDRRRLTAYRVYAAYLRNSARIWVQDDQVKHRREMGDAGSIVRELGQGVLGESPSVQIAEEAREWWETWAEKENFWAAAVLLVEMAIGLGDAVAVLSWDQAKQRPRLAVLDPGFYFPDLEEDRDEFPRSVVVAWEFERDGVPFLRMRRWEIVTRRDPETFDPISIPWPWGTSSEECLYWDGTTKLSDLRRGTGWAAFVGSEPTWEWATVDGELVPTAGIGLGIDFLPVVHIPGDLVTMAEHYGASALGPAIQGLDELAATDTDTANATALTGAPPIGIESSFATVDGAAIETYGPGTVFEGKVTALDMGGAMQALREQGEAWRKRTLATAKVGHLAASFDGQWPSGYALQLGFRPYLGAVSRLRRATLGPLGLIARFAARMAAAGQVLTWPAEGVVPKVVPSSAIPEDVDGTIERVLAMWEARVISREEAVRLLVMVLGIEAADVETFAEAAQHDDLASANALMDLLNDPEAAREYAGLVTSTPPADA